MTNTERMKCPDMNCYVGPVNSWKALGIAIVRQAIIDYSKYNLACAHPDTATSDALKHKRSAEAFLKSPKCEFYSGLDGPTLLRKMKEGKL